jgi:hypothetical protein
MPDTDRIDRRGFVGRLAAGSSAVAGMLAAVAIADEPPVAQKAVEPPTEPAPPDAPAKGADPAGQPPVASQELLLLTCLIRRYPSDHFDETAIQGIYGDLRGDLSRGRILSEFPLTNADAPAFDFRAYRGDD